VKVPHWVRGAESARMVAPLDMPLHMLGLGMSIGTPAGGITADVVAVSTFDELAKLGREKVQGKIVVYNEVYRGYGPTRVYRSSGPSRAAALGAVGALMRSATALAMQIPHTGEMAYDANQPKIPAAAISPEDAMMLARLANEGVPVKVHLEMAAHMEPDADSGDVVGEVPGSEHPEEVVVIGGHIDSWDVGQGAQDDGASIMACLQALALMNKLGLHPWRTVRVAFG
jgi:Zn-dependent M28 family amino/carboxypeptidase